MDPDATLAALRAAIAGSKDNHYTDLDPAVPELAEALIEWLDKGGFLPAAWAKPLSIAPGQWPDFTPGGGPFCPAQDPVSGLMCTLRPHDDATMHAGGTGQRIAGIWA